MSQRAARSLTIAIQMDALTRLNFMTDSTLRLAQAALARGHQVYVFEPQQVSYQPGLLSATARQLSGLALPAATHTLGEAQQLDLSTVDVILLRQDPPYDMGYIASTHLLELVADRVLILNHPTGVRNAPEKLLVQEFPDFLPPTLITRDRAALARFRDTHRDIILKPLFGHAGHGVFHLTEQDENYSTVVETMLAHGPEPLIAQLYLPQVRAGDRRIILIDGEVAGVYARIPADGEARANGRHGSTAQAATLTAREQAICAALKPRLQQLGLFFVGIDVIGDYLTEINVTSPTGLAALHQLYGRDVATDFWIAAEAKLDKPN